MRVEEVITSSGFVALRATWDALFAQAETASPFNSWIWLATWWEMFGAGKELHVFVVWDGDRAIAIAPFYALVFRLGPARLRVLVELGFGNDLTERIEPLIAVGRRAESVGCLGAHLARHCKGLWDIMIWNGVRNDEAPPSLRRLARENHPIPYEVRALPGSWDEFVKGLNKSMRDNIKYYPRLLERHGHQPCVRIAATTAEVGPAIAEFLRLHHLRALATALPSHDDRFGEPRHRQFLDRITPVLVEQGRLRVALLAVDGVNVAAQVVVEHAGTLYIYYSGFDPAWQKYSVGMIATAACIRDAIERGVSAVDFLGGTGQIKQRWDTQHAPLGRVTFLRDSVVADVSFVAYKGLQYLVAQRVALAPRHGIKPRHRLLRWTGKVLGQPVIG